MYEITIVSLSPAEIQARPSKSVVVPAVPGRSLIVTLAPTIGAPPHQVQRNIWLHLDVLYMMLLHHDW